MAGTISLQMFLEGCFTLKMSPIPRRMTNQCDNAVMKILKLGQNLDIKTLWQVRSTKVNRNQLIRESELENTLFDLLVYSLIWEDRWDKKLGSCLRYRLFCQPTALVLQVPSKFWSCAVQVVATSYMWNWAGKMRFLQFFLIKLWYAESVICALDFENLFWI